MIRILPSIRNSSHFRPLSHLNNIPLSSSSSSSSKSTAFDISSPSSPPLSSHSCHVSIPLALSSATPATLYSHGRTALTSHALVAPWPPICAVLPPPRFISTPAIQPDADFITSTHVDPRAICWPLLLLPISLQSTLTPPTPFHRLPRMFSHPSLFGPP